MSESNTTTKPSKPKRRLCHYPLSLVSFLKSILTCLTLTLLMGSCTKDELIELPSSDKAQQNASFAPITFDTQTEQSRAQIADRSTLMRDGFGIYAYTSDNVYSPDEFEANFMYNQKVFNTTGTWEYSPLKYWTSTLKNTTFLAYGPYQPTSSTIVSYVEDSSNPTSRATLKYNLPTEVDSQIDLVYGSAIDVDGVAAPTIQFKFRHALSRVAFAAKSELTYEQQAAGMTIKVNRIIVESMGDNPIPTSGRLSLDTGEWSDFTTTGTTLVLDEDNFNFTTLTKKDRLITNADSYLMLIPQRSAYKNFNARSRVEIDTAITRDYQYDCKQSSDRTLSKDIKAQLGKNNLSHDPLKCCSSSQFNALNPQNRSGSSSDGLSYGSSQTDYECDGDNSNCSITSNHDHYNSRSYTAPDPVDWKIIVESVIVEKNGTEHPNTVYADCSDVIFTQGYGYEIRLTVGVNSLKVTINEGRWNQIDQNEWFTMEAHQEEFHIEGTIPNMGRDDAEYTIVSLYDAALRVELLKQQKKVYPGKFVLDENYIDISGLVKRNNCYVIVENNHGQRWNLPIKFQYGYMQMTIEITDDQDQQKKTYVLPVGKGDQPATLLIEWGDGTYSSEIRTLTDENNSHLYESKGQYPLRILTAQTNYQLPQIKYICHGVEDMNRDEIPDDAPYKTDDPTSYLNDMPDRLISLDTPLLRYQRNVHSTLCGCSRLKTVNQNLFRYNSQLSDVSYCFMGCLVLQRVPELWTLSQFTRHVHTYLNCYPTNLSAIPESWK